MKVELLSWHSKQVTLEGRNISGETLTELAKRKGVCKLPYIDLPLRCRPWLSVEEFAQRKKVCNEGVLGAM